MSFGKRWILFSYVILAASAFAPLLASYFWRLWSLPHYQLFPLTLAGCALLLKRDVVAPGRSETGAIAASSAGAATCWLLLAVAILLFSPWLAYLAFLAGVAMTAYAWGGRSALRRSGPTLLLGLTLLRPPFGLETDVILFLQSFTAVAAGHVLDFLGVMHHLAGNVVEIPGRSMLVEEACSGLTSLISVCSLTLFYSLWHRRSLTTCLLLLLASVVWTVFANIARITVIAVLRYYFDVAADEGFRHDISGFASFGLALLLVWSTDCWLRFCTAVLKQTSRSVPTAIPPTGFAPQPITYGRRFQIGVLCGTAAWLWLVACQVPLVAVLADDVRAASRNSDLQQSHERLFPPRDGLWSRHEVESVERARTSAFGQFTERAEYRTPGRNLVVTLDYPFAGWHDLATCYAGQGWVITSRSQQRDARGTVFVRMRLRHYAQGRHAYCTFTLLGDDGSPIVPPAEARVQRFAERWQQTLGNVSPWLYSPATAGRSERPAFQTQVFLEQFAEPSEEVVVTADAVLQRFVERARQVLQGPDLSSTSREGTH